MLNVIAASVIDKTSGRILLLAVFPDIFVLEVLVDCACIWIDFGGGRVVWSGVDEKVLGFEMPLDDRSPDIVVVFVELLLGLAVGADVGVFVDAHG